jgi:hypothetical protein
MPSDIKNFEGMFPYYFDPRYDQALNTFEPGSLQHIDETIQSMAEEIIGRKLSPEKLEDVKRELDSKGYFCRNTGDPSFHQKVESLLKKYMTARKVVHAFRSK